MLTERAEFAGGRDAQIFDAIPAAPAVFLLRGSNPESQPYITKTANLRRRLQRLLSAPTEQSKRLNLRDWVRWIEYTCTGSDFESGFLLYRVLRSVFPQTYSRRLKLRFAPLLRLHLENAYPRVSITTRIGRLGGQARYYGPFPSRIAADKFANDSLDFFKLRRCVEDLRPDPLFPGCIYSEMKMCLAPCFKGCADAEYQTEVSRVQDYFDSNGESLLRELSVQRDKASAGMMFEDAAVLHTRIEKIESVVGQLSGIVRQVDQLSGVMVQRSSESNCVTLFRIHGGFICDPLPFPLLAGDRAKSQSTESRIVDAISSIPLKERQNALALMEHLALLRRWFYRSSKTGEIFFAENKGVLPFRRIVRGISRVYRGEKPESQILLPADSGSGQSH